MASAFGHVAAAAALGAAFHRGGDPRRFWILGAACAVLPDADVVGLAFGVPFLGIFGHRGLSHSVAFAAAVAALVVAVGFRGTTDGPSRARLGVYFFVATASHGVLDAMTDGGPGIAFLAPFDGTRYFLPFRPIVVSPLGIPAFFSAWGLRVIESEALWIGLPAAIFAVGALVARGWRVRRAGGGSGPSG